MRNPPWAALVPTPDWPGQLHPPGRRVSAPFKSTESDTWYLLHREVEKLAPRQKVTEADVRLGMAYQVAQLTADGSRPRAHELPAHPGVVVTFVSAKSGELRYLCDTFIRPADNLRAIAKTLENLRAITRWGALDTEQYIGNRLELEAGIAGSGTPFSHHPDSIRVWLADLISEAVPEIPALVTDDPRNLIRRAQRATHPDHGGDPELFRLVAVAEQYLREARQL